MPMPSPAYYRGQTDRRYHGVPSGCLLGVQLPAKIQQPQEVVPSSRRLGERTQLLAFLDDNRTGCRVGKIGQRLAVALYSPLLLKMVHAEWRSSRSCSSPGPGLHHPVRHTSCANAGRYRRGSRRQSAQSPGRPHLSSATATSDRS